MSLYYNETERVLTGLTQAMTKETFRIGDEVNYLREGACIILKLYTNYRAYVMNSEGAILNANINELSTTGKHFEEFDTILNELKETHY